MTTITASRGLRTRFALSWGTSLTFIACCVILLGVFLRVGQLSSRTLFDDEAITQIRVAGYTYADVVKAVYDGEVRRVADLHHLFSVSPRSTPQRLVASLTAEDAQHPPLFYLAELATVRLFGDSLISWRILPVLFGILGIAGVYALTRTVFGESRTALLAAALFAVSPIERIYSLQAREYSLLVFLVLIATLSVFRAVRTNDLRWWALYALTMTAGFYTSPFVAYVLAGHAVFVIGASGRRRARTFVRFAVAAGAALAASAPWLIQLFVHRHSIVETNAWSGTRWPIFLLAVKWIFNAGATFFDLEYVDVRWAAVLAAVCLVAAWAIYRGFARSSGSARWCLGTAIAIPALLLVVPDLLLGEHRSAVARYGLPVFALVPVVVARGLKGRPWIATALLVAGLVASTVGAGHATWWDNDTNGADSPTAAAIDAAPRAQIVSSISPPDLVGLARQLDGSVRISLSYDLARTRFSPRDPVFVVRPDARQIRAFATGTGRACAPVPIEQARTAHQLGSQMAGGPSAETNPPPLWSCTPGGVRPHRP